MFTTCPNCALNLAVTAADLRIGQGYVRCGRCVSVFNALISLADEAEVSPGEAPRIEDRAAATQSRPAPTDLSEVPADALPAEAPAAEVGEESRDMSTGTFETIVLEGDAILQTEEFVDESEVDEQLQALARQLEVGPPPPPADEDGDPDEAADDAELEGALPRRALAFAGVDDEDAGDEAGAGRAGAPDGSPLPESLQEDAAGLLPGGGPRRRLSKWTLVAAGLAVVLAAQAAHHWRYPLAERMPWVGRAYAGMGAPLAPQWRVEAYEVRQLGATTDPANAARIEVRATVRNAASVQQPAPLLRVVLQDRYGNEISRRELSPVDYVRGTPVRMLAADQRIDASLWVDDPEQKAVGFEIDACLGTSDGDLRCAADAPRTTASR